MHAILPPTVKRADQNSKKKVVKYTIKDSQEEFLLTVATTNDIGNSIDKLRTKLSNRGETLQPLIIAVGENFKTSNFYVCVDDVKYKLANFLSAIDICFNAFQVLNLEYPKACLTFWTFIQNYLYKTAQFAKHFQSFEVVEKKDNYFCFKLPSFFSSPVHIYYLPNKKSFVRPKYY